MTYNNICVPSFLRKKEDSLCDSCRYRNMDDDETPCGDCMEDCSVMDDDIGREFMDRCRKHLESLPTAVSVEKGHNRTLNVAHVIFHDYAMDDVNGWIVLLEYNSRCQPPWSVEELRHIMQQAIEQPPSDRPRGKLRDKFVSEIDGDEE